MNLKTTPRTAIELASVNVDGTTELLGIEPLCEVSFTIQCAIKNKVISQENTFLNVFGLGCYFFYSVDQVRKDKVIKSERGIGTLYQENNRTYLKREFPIEQFFEDGSQTACQGLCASFYCSDCDHIIAKSSYPIKYVECLYDKNIIISSNGPFSPRPVPVSSNSILGRLDDDLESLTFKDLISNDSFQQELINLLKKYSKQINFGSSMVTMKKLQTANIQMQNADTTKAKKNSIVLDDNVLKFYDGESWYKISMEKI